MMKFAVTHTKKNQFGTWQVGKIGVLVNFIIQKLKSKLLVCLSFFWLFEGARGNILHIFRAQGAHSGSLSPQTSHSQTWLKCYR